MKLTPCKYDQLEQAAKVNLTNCVVRMGSPVGFERIGFPVRVSSVRELHRYADTMHEGRASIYYEDMGGLTDEELTIFDATVMARDKALSKIRAPARNYDVASILSAINIARLINRHKAPGSTVFEVGAGSGYLSCVLALAGYRVISTDITQAFCLWQSHLYDAIGVSITQMPWWEFFTLYDRLKLPAVDVFTCNHALAEMDDQARSYVIRIAKRMLAPVNGKFILEGWGSELLSTEGSIQHQMKCEGFRFAQESWPTAVLSLGDRTPILPNLYIWRRLKKRFFQVLRLFGINPSSVFKYIPNFEQMMLSVGELENQQSPDERLFDFTQTACSAGHARFARGAGTKRNES